ncbi:MAG: LysR family transcriptional regulator [Anaeromyxobacteraceae bacterium]
MPVDLELRLLRSFQVLAAHGHFGRAAGALHLSQPALTKQVRQLEDAAGLPLFLRGRHGAQLTPAGRLFAAEVAPLLRQADHLGERARRIARGEVGELRLGFGIATRLFVPRLVSRFRAQHPDVSVALQDMSTPTQVDALGRGELDVGFVRLPVDRPLVHVPVVEERLVLAVPAARAAALGKLSGGVLGDEPFVELDESRSPSFHAHVNRVCARYGFRPRVVQAAKEFFTVLALVSAGAGIGIVPRTVTATRVEGVVILPLLVPEAAWRVGAAWLPGPGSPLRDAFLRALRAELDRRPTASPGRPGPPPASRRPGSRGG